MLNGVCRVGGVDRLAAITAALD
ncbi:hypothetical protein [Sphingomonas trueperi]